MDFTINSYKKLLCAFKDAGYSFVTFSEYLNNAEKYSSTDKIIIMRHDVDEQAKNALRMAQVEHSLGLKATYFFRIVKQSNKPDIIRAIVNSGHEIGYHYEDLSTYEGDYKKAIESFASNLEYFREFYPVKTICMHGSSTSKYDNRKLWKEYDLQEFQLLGEPYLSIDFSKVYYMTDTGYAWDGGKYITRDVVESPFKIKFHSTPEVVAAVKSGSYPQKAMILAHTLWTNNLVDWTYLHLREFVRNHIKHLATKNKLIASFYKKIVALYWGKKR